MADPTLEMAEEFLEVLVGSDRARAMGHASQASNGTQPQRAQVEPGASV